MELNRRRKPLSNITNILPISPWIKPKSNDTNTTSIGSNKTENPRTRSQTLSSLHRPKSVDIFVDGACETQSVVRGNDKGTKNTRFELDKEHPDRNKLHKEQIGVSLSKSSIVPRQESTRSKNSENSRSQSQACTPERLKSPADFDDVDFDGSKTKTVYSRRQGLTKVENKGKAVAATPLSCPPPKRTKTLWDDSEKEQGGVCSSKTCIVRNPKGKKRRFSMPEVSQDFINQQNAYFAEIDDFELSTEEVASESELE